MDFLIVLLLSVGVALFSGLIIYFILVSTMKEKTYDEVKAEQKKKAEEYFAQGRSAKEKAKDKKLKKAGKKVKEKTTTESVDMSSEEVDSSKAHVAFVEPPTVVDEEPPVIEEKKRKKNKKKEKPILVNKNEITPVVEVPPLIINHFEQIIPKDDFLLKRNSICREEVEVKVEPSVISTQKQLNNKHTKAQAIPPKEPKVDKSQPQKLNQQPPKPEKEKVTAPSKPTEKPTNPKQVEKTAVPPKPVEKPTKPASKPSEKPTNLPSKQSEKPQNPSKSTEKPAVALKQQEKPNPKPQDKPQAQPKPVEEVVVVKSSAKQAQSAPVVNVEHSPSTTKSSRKKRSELATLQQMSGDREAINVNLLMPLVHKAELSRTEIQVLIDLLLNKQQGSSVDSAEWIEGRQDPVVKLKKQLAEKEKALAAEQEAATALQSKLRELRSELNAEKHSTRQLEESLQARQSELGNLAGRLQHSSEEKQSLLQQIQQLQGELSDEHMMLCKLQEDQGQTQSVMQQELLAQRQQLELHIARLTEQHQENLAAMEAQLGQMASQLQEREAVNNTLTGELAMIRDRGAQSQDLARQVKELHSEIERVMSKSQYETGRLQSEVNSLTEQLSLKRAESDKLSSLVQSLQAENNRLTQKVSTACVEAKQLRDENETLAAQVTASMERPATEGRENGDLSYPENKHIDSNSDKMHEKELLVEKLKGDIVSKEREINHFKTDLAQQELLTKSLQGELDVAHSNAEKMLNEISSYKCLLQEQESVINALRDDGDSAHKLVNTLREDITKNKAEIVRLSKDCATVESRESAIEKLTSELNTHKTKLADQAALIQTLQQEVERYKASVTSLEEVYNKSKTLCDTYKTDLAKKEALIESLTMQADKYRTEVNRLTEELTNSKETVCKLTQEIKDYVDRQATFSRDLETQKRKNDELRSKNWKAMEALSRTEKTLETKVKESQRLVSEAEESTKHEERERTKQFLQRLFPHVTVDIKQDYDVWLEQFVMEACQNASASADQSGDNVLGELEQQNCQLQAMVTHYKTIIADTEEMLNRLQSHVEQEEGRWGQQIQTLESQLEAVRLERDRLEENSELATQLESALTRNKELSHEMTRLQALIRIGEKSVSDQVDQTLQLKEELETLKAGTKNGLSTVDVGSDTN
ncbi:kinectin isoform X3 [Homalodisca vitripennis]|nr:kinectin isoform X3 [Homalodisca vitripennis]